MPSLPLRRVKAYSERRFAGNLAELLLSYGFKEPVYRESLFTLRHFWKPRQVNPLRLKPLLDLARLQGWLSPPPPSSTCRGRVVKTDLRKWWTLLPVDSMKPESPETEKNFGKDLKI